MGNTVEKKAKPNFFKEVRQEFKKIVWPDKKDTFKQSVAVACISIVVGVIIAVLDYFIQFGVNWLTNL